MTTDNTETVKAIMARYERDMELSNRIAVAVKENAGERLRHLLMPILNRWGMGMKVGGNLLYLNPNIGGSDVVEMDKGCDYVLGELHNELAGALWEEVHRRCPELPCNEVDGGSTLHDYIEDIDIPTDDLDDGGVEYVWLVSWGGQFLKPLSFDESMTLDAEDTNDYSTSTKYYGPVTQAFIDDTGIGTVGHDPHPYLDTLPKYTLTGDGTWVRLLDEVLVQPPNEECISTTYTLYYDSNSPPIRDVDIEDTVSRLHYQDIYTSTGLVVEAALCHMYEGKLPPIRILIEGRPMEFDEDGVVKYWAGFPTYDYAKRLLLATLGKWNTGGGSNHD